MAKKRVINIHRDNYLFTKSSDPNSRGEFTLTFENSKQKVQVHSDLCHVQYIATDFKKIVAEHKDFVERVEKVFKEGE